MEGTKERNREGPTVVRALRLQRATCVAPDSTSGDHASTFPVGPPTPSHMGLVSCLVLEAVTRWVGQCLPNEGDYPRQRWQWAKYSHSEQRQEGLG